MTRTPTHIGFQRKPLYRLRRTRLLHIARQKFSFIIASLTIFSFVIGNMVGQHGLYAFWKTVLGKGDEATVVFVGTVPPIAMVPDYAKWATYGGTPVEHTFSMVPSSVLVPLPAYDATAMRTRSGENLAEAVYSVGNLGSYDRGEDHGGSHVGVDIRVPTGTPVQSIANGLIEKISLQEYGYGHHVVVKHPNVPDPAYPGKLTTLYSIYAHLDSVLVSEGQLVHKGEKIALSGKSGFASGPHLHFQIDNSSAPFHPYWPFTTAEATEARLDFTGAINAGLHQERGKAFTVSPLLYVQAHRADVQQTVVASATPTRVASVGALVQTQTQGLTAKARAIDRLRQRIAKAGFARPIDTAVVSVGGTNDSIADNQPTAQIVAQNGNGTPVSSVKISSSTDVDHLSIEHSGKLSRSWQTVTISARDHDGNIVLSPSFGGRLYVIAEFGEAEIRPSELSSMDFQRGVATVHVLTRGRKTTFIALRGAFTAQSAPMVSDER